MLLASSIPNPPACIGFAMRSLAAYPNASNQTHSEAQPRFKHVVVAHRHHETNANCGFQVDVIIESSKAKGHSETHHEDEP